MNLVRAIGVGAFSLLALGGWKLFDNFRKKAKLPTKQETLLILESIRHQFYPVLVKIADIVTRELISKGLSPEDNETLVLGNTAIKGQIEAINAKIYDKYSEDEVKEAIQNIYKQDGDILKQRHLFRQEYKKSLLGIKPEQQMVVSRKINKSKVLEAIRQILKDKIERLKIQRLGSVEESEQRAILEGDIQQDERVTKQKIKDKLGLYAKDAIQIFHFIVAKYKNQDNNFAKQYEQIVKDYNEKARDIIPI